MEKVCLELPWNATHAEVCRAFDVARKPFYEARNISKYKGPGVKTVALADFIGANPYDKKTMRWETLIEKWDKQYPNWAYGEKTHAKSSFPRDCRRAARSVLGIGF